MLGVSDIDKGIRCQSLLAACPRECTFILLQDCYPYSKTNYYYNIMLSTPLFIFLLVFLQAYGKQSSQSLHLQGSEVMCLSQYHFLPIGSYFQYSIDTAQVDYDGDLLKKVNVTFNITFISLDPVYNLFIFPYFGSEKNKVQGSKLFNCYQRTVDGGIQSMFCPISNYTAKDGNCTPCINSFATNPTPFACLNCTNSTINYNIITTSHTLQNPIESIIYIIDNSGLFFNSSVVQQSYLNFILDQRVFLEVSQEDRALLFLFCGIVAVLICLASIVSVYLFCKIRRVDEEIHKCEEKNKEV